jgi:hypothetical protein
MAEQLTFFASLDFPGRTTLLLWEIAERLGCTVKHLLEQVDSGELVGLDVRSAEVSRRSMRIPVECYRDYILRRMTGDADHKMRFLRDLPAATRRQLIDELRASLHANP